MRIQWEALAKDQPEDLKKRFEELKKLDEKQEIIDAKKGIEDKDNRMMMRVSLSHYRRSCIECGKIPEGRTPSNCQICGGF